MAVCVKLSDCGFPAIQAATDEALVVVNLRLDQSLLCCSASSCGWPRHLQLLHASMAFSSAMPFFERSSERSSASFFLHGLQHRAPSDFTSLQISTVF